MIKIENTDVIGWDNAIRGMRNPMNSWDSSDSFKCFPEPACEITCDAHKRNQCKDGFRSKFVIGNKDYDLMKRLRVAGTDHRKFMRMITVYVDITAPLYWWKEFDTYKIGTVGNSCSTMHKIQAKIFEPCDFSHDNLDEQSMACLNTVIAFLNENRDMFLQTKDKHYWWQMIQLLPSSYNQKRTEMLNYEVLANIYKSRKAHKLNEWNENYENSFCSWIKLLPYSELITGDF